MAEPLILVPGGSGVFGRLLAREILATTSAAVLLAARDAERLRRARASLPHPGRVGLARLDLRDLDALAALARRCTAVACAAGPFQALPRELPAVCVTAGAHWVDIADDPAWVLGALDDRSLRAAAEATGVAVVPGASTLPALSGVLARWCVGRTPGATRASVALFIGNRNRKGAGASSAALLGGFREPAVVPLAIGPRTAFRFDSPDPILLARDLGLRADVRVALELGPAGRAISALGPVWRALPPPARAALARALVLAAAPVSTFGSDIGCVQVEVRDGRESTAAALLSRGQRLAVLPAALAIAALLDGTLSRRGAVHPVEWLPVKEWLRRLRAASVRVLVSARP